MGYWDMPGASDEWYTPKYIFEALGEKFDLDPAHPEERCTHVPAVTVLYERGLQRQWYGFVWLNPPFAGRNSLSPWLTKFFDHGNGIALTPDRTSAPWFREAWARADLALFTPKIRFIRPDGTQGKSPSNGTTLWAAGKRAQAALGRAAVKGLGILAIPASVDIRPKDEDPAQTGASLASGAVTAEGGQTPNLPEGDSNAR